MSLRRIAAAAAAFASASLLANTFQATSVSAQALHEATSGHVMFGAWVQTEEGDDPAKFNSRLGLNASVIQIAQNIPLRPYNYTTGAGGPAPEYLIERSGTDAAVFLTVYPSEGFDTLTPDDFTALGNQLLNYTSNYNRTTFLRWAPEMNGNWNAYGLQPIAYVAVWQAMYTAIKAISPSTAMVWAPNTGQGYPYSMPLPDNQTEANALDTNGDGALTVADSPFAPYYPGDEYVDWVGLSVYYKGPNSQNINVEQPRGYCYDALVNFNPNDGTAAADPWYSTYCNRSPSIACMFAESGAAYHDMIFGDQGVSDLALKRAWWQDCLTNTSLFETYPRLKLMMQFEYEKNETDGGINDHRDYRLTNKTDILQGFQSDLATMSDVYTWANYRPVPVSTPNVVTATQVYTTTDSDGMVVTATSRVTTSTFSFITVRNTQTGFPSLFGEYASDALRSVVISVAMFATSCSVVLGGMIFLMRV